MTDKQVGARHFRSFEQPVEVGSNVPARAGTIVGTHPHLGSVGLSDAGERPVGSPFADLQDHRGLALARTVE